MEHRDITFEQVEFYWRDLPWHRRVMYKLDILAMAHLFLLMKVSKDRMRYIVLIEGIITILAIIAVFTFNNIAFTLVAGFCIGAMIVGTIVAISLGRFIPPE